ncbi:MAG: hypothetical protein ACRDRX_20090 [Pseudonocardiaceae bacterium]
MCDPPGVGLLDFVPEPSGAVLADRVSRGPAVDVNGGPGTRNGVMDPDEVVIFVIGIILHDLVTVGNQQTDYASP